MKSNLSQDFANNFVYILFSRTYSKKKLSATYRYRITVYDEGKARVLSFDYPFAANENLSVKDIGWIYNILINLSWE
jgi:hypothetical protein